MVSIVHVIKAHSNQYSRMSYIKTDLQMESRFTQKWESMQGCVFAINPYIKKKGHEEWGVEWGDGNTYRGRQTVKLLLK